LDEARVELAALKQAHHASREALDAAFADLRQRLHPTPTAAPAAITFEYVAGQYLAQLVCKNPKDRVKVEHRFKRNLYPVLGQRSFRDIEPRELADAVLAISKRGRKSMAKKVLSDIKSLYSWAVQCGKATQSPAALLRPKACGAEHNARPRVLSDDEIRSLWSALDDAGPSEEKNGPRPTPTTALALKAMLAIGCRPRRIVPRPLGARRLQGEDVGGAAGEPEGEVRSPVGGSALVVGGGDLRSADARGWR
jgi:hypothetical protein